MKRENSLKSRVSLPIYVASGLVFLLLLASNFVVLHFAGGEAHDIRQRVERSLVVNEVDRQMDQMAHEQARISFLDDTIHAISNEIDQEFLRTKLARWLWEDFGIQYSIIVSPNNHARAFVFEHDVMDPSHGDQIIEENIDLVELAQAQYLQHRVEHADGGYRLDAHPTSSDKSIHAMAFRKFHGQIGIVAAQAIVPHHEAANPDGHPHTLLTFKPVHVEVLADMSEKLGIGSLEILPVSAANGSEDQFILPDDSGHNRYLANWHIVSPWPQIFRESGPTLLALAIVAATLLGHLAIRHARAVFRLRASEARNRHMALHDALTGLPNRVQLDQALRLATTAPAPTPSAVLCIDLDKFKMVNDTFGHAAGDLVIRTAARRIRACVGDKGLAARVGGDEFVVLIRADMSEAALKLLGDLIIEQLKLEIPFEGGSAFIGASVGVARFPDQAANARELMQHADMALYRAKEAGRGTTVCFTDGMAVEAA